MIPLWSSLETYVCCGWMAFQLSLSILSIKRDEAGSPLDSSDHPISLMAWPLCDSLLGNLLLWLEDFFFTKSSEFSWLSAWKLYSCIIREFIHRLLPRAESEQYFFCRSGFWAAWGKLSFIYSLPSAFHVRHWKSTCTCKSCCCLLEWFLWNPGSQGFIDKRFVEAPNPAEADQGSLAEGSAFSIHTYKELL